MSDHPTTQRQSLSPAATPVRSDGGFDLLTLAITAVASAVAAYTCSKVWAPGTLASAAFTPVLVALVKEGLRRPADVVITVVPVTGPRRRGRRDAVAPGAATQVAGPRGTQIPEPDVLAVSPPQVTTLATSPRRTRWRLAVLTGLLGFAVCAALYTVPELLAGSAASGGGRTTLWGGSHGHRQVPRTTTTSTTTVVVPGKTVTKAAPTTTKPASTSATAPAAPVAPTTPAPTTSVTTPATPPPATTTSTDPVPAPTP